MLLGGGLINLVNRGVQTTCKGLDHAPCVIQSAAYSFPSGVMRKTVDPVSPDARGRVCVHYLQEVNCTPASLAKSSRDLVFRSVYSPSFLNFTPVSFPCETRFHSRVIPAHIEFNIISLYNVASVREGFLQ